jgi:lipid-binding SYLF domain-containing protein
LAAVQVPETLEKCPDEKRKVKQMKRVFVFFIAMGFTASLRAAEDDAQRLKTAGEVLGEIESAPDKSVPNDLFHKASCVIVIPSMKKAGFIFSGKYGRGYASCRKPAGGWTAPAGMRIEGGGFGLQAGGSATDVIMLVMSKRGMEGVLSSKFTLGGEASVAAGPVGRDATAQTDATMKADILSWSRSRGVFGGLSLQGGTLRPDEDANKALYGEKVSSQDILTGKVSKPIASDTLTAKLIEYGGTSKTN